MRAATKNDFEKQFFKVMKKSIYGKSWENKKKQTDINVITSEQKCKPLVEKPQCIGFIIFDAQYLVVKMRIIKTHFNIRF